MANGYVSPVPSRPPYRHSLAGPILLILIGVLFLMQHLNSGFSVFLLFARWWPLLLILVGVIKLVEHLVYQHLDYPEAHFGGGTVTLLILICIFGGISSAAYKHRDEIDWGEMQDNIHVGDNDGFWNLFGNQYTFDQQMTQALPANASLRIVNSRGGVTVTPSDEQVIRVTAHKHIFAGSNSEADKRNRESLAQFTSGGGNIMVLTSNTEGSSKVERTDLEVSVPRSVWIEVTTYKGDVSVSNRDGQVKVNNQHGDINVDNIKGDVYLYLDHGSAHANGVTGNLLLNGHTDNATIAAVSGTASLSGEYNGDVHLEKIARGVHYSSMVSDITIPSLTGTADFDNDNLRLDQATGPIAIKTKSKDIDLKQVSGEMKIESNTGNINVEPKAPISNMQIVCRHGDVVLQMPEKSSFQLEALTHHGEVHSDFEGVKTNNPDHGDATGAGGPGRGGTHISISSDSGNIDLNKAK